MGKPEWPSWPTQYIVLRRLEPRLLATASSSVMQSLSAFLLPCSLSLLFHLPNKLPVTKSVSVSTVEFKGSHLVGKMDLSYICPAFKLKRYNCLRTPNCQQIYDRLDLYLFHLYVLVTSMMIRFRDYSWIYGSMEPKDIAERSHSLNICWIKKWKNLWRE